MYAVQNGEVDAGTVRTDTLERMAAAGDISLDEFKIINRQDHSGFPFVASTSLYPEWPFAKLSSTPEEISNKVAQALLALPADSKAAQNAKIVGWYDADTASCRRALTWRRHLAHLATLVAGLARVQQPLHLP